MPPLPPPDAPFEMSVQNLVFTGVLGTLVRLKHVALALAKCGAELNQKRFSAVILRMHLNAKSGPFDEDILLQQLRPVVVVRPRLDKIAVLIFRNGNLVCTGAKTFAQARYMLLRTAQQLRDIGYDDARIVRMNIRNMVGRAQLPCRIDRERMAREIPAFATYDPAHFPGVSVKHPLTRPITLLVFNSGRVVVTGTRSKAIADAALARIKPLLTHFDVNTSPGTLVPDVAWPGDVVDTALYDVLGVNPKATMRKINSAFRKKALKFHPDKNTHLKPGTEEYAQVDIEFKRISAAYELLNDPVKRDTYDFTGEGREVIDIVNDDASGEDSSDDVDDPVATAAVHAATIEDFMEAAMEANQS